MEMLVLTLDVALLDADCSRELGVEEMAAATLS